MVGSVSQELGEGVIPSRISQTLLLATESLPSPNRDSGVEESFSNGG